MDVYNIICNNNRIYVVVRMVIKSWGIIIFDLIRYVKFIKEKIMLTQTKALQKMYNCEKQRHEKAIQPTVIKVAIEKYI